MVQRNQRVQRGFIFPVKNKAGKIASWHVRYRETKMQDGKPVRVLKSHKLCDRDDKFFSVTCKAVQDKCDEFMHGISPIAAKDMPVHEFWEKTYLPFIRENMKASTVNGYVQIWNQHLDQHFAPYSLQDYETHMCSQFLLTLTKTQGLRTLNHVRSLASGIFTHAINLGLLKQNPIHHVKILGKVRPSKPTGWYTLEEAENIISALVDHVDCQLVMALACFLGLRPGEIAALRWEDFDNNFVHIRRAIAGGLVGTTKTPESVASLNLEDPVRLFFNLWREKCGNLSEGWVFKNERGNPANLKDMVSRTIRPAVEAKNLTWKSIYAGRRGVATALIANGDTVGAQELLRHKDMTTMNTLFRHYKKQTPAGLSKAVSGLATQWNELQKQKTLTVGSEE